MAKSKRITHADIQQMFRLIGECRELGDDPITWRRHLQAGIASLIDADFAAGGEVAGCLSGKLTSPGVAVWGCEHGFNPDGLRILWEWNDIDPDISVLWARYRRQLAPAGLTVARYQILSDAQWDRSPDYQQAMRTMGADVVMHSFHQLPSGGDAFEGVCWFRSRGRHEFNDREVAVVSLVHQEAIRLIGGALAAFHEPHPSQLPRRVRQVLRLLLEGESDKRIAHRLSLSTHTVNQYVKRIYQHFGVSGRAELLARWIRRGWSTRAAWDHHSEEQSVLHP